MSEDLSALSDVAAEQALLAAIFIDESRQVSVEVDGDVKASDFSRPAHGVLFDAMIRMSRRGVAVDIVTLKGELEQVGKMEEAGGLAYLMGIVDFLPTAANWRHYRDQVLRASRQRAVFEAATKLRAESLANVHTREELESLVEATLESALRGRQSGQNLVPVSASVVEALERLEAIFYGNAPEPVTTGLSDLDDFLGGYLPGELHVLAGRVAMGKSVFGATVAMRSAMKGARVAVFTGEMSHWQYSQRMLAAMVQEDYALILDPKPHRLEAAGMRTEAARMNWLRRVVEGGELIKALPIQYDDSGAITPGQIAARSRVARRRMGGLDLVIVDYLQRLDPDPTTKRNVSKAEEVAQIAKALKTMAREQEVPILVMAQVGRVVESRSDKRPYLGDLSDSSGVEKEADSVTFIHRPAYYERPVEETDDRPTDRSAALRATDPKVPEIAEAVIAKNRRGRTGIVKIGFQGAYQRFVAVKEAEEVAFGTF